MLVFSRYVQCVQHTLHLVYRVLQVCSQHVLVRCLIFHKGMPAFVGISADLSLLNLQPLTPQSGNLDKPPWQQHCQLCSRIQQQSLLITGLCYWQR